VDGVSPGRRHGAGQTNNLQLRGHPINGDRPSTLSQQHPQALPLKEPAHHSGKAGGAPPTAKMVAYAKSLAGNKKVKLPPNYAQDFETCRRFLDQHSR